MLSGELWLIPLVAGRCAGERARELVQARDRPSDRAREARKQRLVDRLVMLEPQLHRSTIDAGAIARAFPSLADQAAQLARTVELVGWPGVQIRVADDWFALGIAPWPELATDEIAGRLVTLVEVVRHETGWVCIDEHNTVIDEPRTAIDRVFKRSTVTGHRFWQCIARLRARGALTRRRPQH